MFGFLLVLGHDESSSVFSTCSAKDGAVDTQYPRQGGDRAPAASLGKLDASILGQACMRAPFATQGG
jgi:hypothetical protein